MQQPKYQEKIQFLLKGKRFVVVLLLFFDAGAFERNQKVSLYLNYEPNLWRTQG